MISTRVIMLALTLAVVFNIQAAVQAQQSRAPVGATQSPFKSPYNKGVLTLEFVNIDDLLLLSKVPGLRIVEITKDSEAEVSSVHLYSLMQWVNGGGVAWFHSSGFGSSLFRKVNPGVERDYAAFYKESSANFVNGELFVKDILPQIRIASHKITTDVSMIYVIPSENGSKQNWYLKSLNTNLTPIISFLNVSDGIHGNFPPNTEIILFGIIEKGSGLIILDATKIGQKIWKGPDGKEYDGPKFYSNILNFSH